jgi:hypothetical protein
MIVNGIVYISVYYRADRGILASGGKRLYKGAKWIAEGIVIIAHIC